MPPGRPLDMPRQSLVEGPRASRGADRRIQHWAMASLCLLTAALEAGLLGWAFSSRGLSLVELALIVISVLLTAWIGLGFATAVVGMSLAWGEPVDADPEETLITPPSGPGRVALLLPAYQEDPGLVLGAAEAMAADLRRLGAERRFDIFVLSDTREGGAARDEFAAFVRLRARSGSEPAIFYRRRAENTDRKAGNIADWVSHHGSAYAYMVTLDADSLLTAETLLALTAEMDASPNLGLLQTTPGVLNARTLYARLQQFAARLYGPIFARGHAWWTGDESNYYGHNAIVRVAAFAQSAGLPHLNGPKPWGGHILSHDFVEAALLRRRGWAVRAAPRLRGSFEEAPPTLIDAALRDRRWSQGNLQHLRIVGAHGLHPVSRLHLIFGALAYLASPAWLLLVVLGALVWPQERFLPGDPARRAVAAAFAFNLALLAGPKILALAVALRRGEARRWPGRAVGLVASVLAETVLSLLLTPVSMVMQSMAIFDVLIGRDSGWKVQRREAQGLTWRDAWRVHWGHVLLGVTGAIGALCLSRDLLIWAGPVFLSLALSSVLSLLTSRPAPSGGRALGLFATPEETAPPPAAALALTRRTAYAQEADTRAEIDILLRGGVPLYVIAAPGLAGIARRRVA